MGYGIIDTSTLTDIADAIREKLGVQTQYKPGQMPEAIASISGGGITPTGTKSITANGTYDVASYASAEVNVPSVTPTGTKQVSITQNGVTTEDVTAYANAQISVNVVNQDYEDALVALGVTEDLTDGIEALTTYANGVTGESDTTLSDAVASLADGYGGGGSDYEGLEVQYNSNKVVTGYVWHGRTVPTNALTRLQYSTPLVFPISFPDLPTYFGNSALMYSRIKVNWADLREVEVLGSSSMRQDFNNVQGYDSAVVNMPKLTGIGSGNTPFGYMTGNAPSEYHFDGMTNIVKEMFTNISHPNFTVSFGSVGTAVQTCGLYPFHNSTATASGTITVYTTGALLDTIKTALENSTGSGSLTFVYKAAEATTYNDTNYQAGDTILTTTPT